MRQYIENYNKQKNQSNLVLLGIIIISILINIKIDAYCESEITVDNVIAKSDLILNILEHDRIKYLLSKTMFTIEQINEIHQILNTFMLKEGINNLLPIYSIMPKWEEILYVLVWSFLGFLITVVKCLFFPFVPINGIDVIGCPNTFFLLKEVQIICCMVMEEDEETKIAIMKIIEHARKMNPQL